jgi:hypothetical protein
MMNPSETIDSLETAISLLENARELLRVVYVANPELCVALNDAHIHWNIDPLTKLINNQYAELALIRSIANGRPTAG